MRYVDLSQETKDAIAKEIIESDMLADDICKKYNIGGRIYKKIREEYGIKRKSPIKKTRYNFNEDYFNKVDTEEKAYWLGFLYADGYITSRSRNFLTGLALSKCDKPHIEKFNKALNSSYPIHTYHNEKDGSSYSRVVLASKKMYNNLNRLGCVPLKTNILRFPTSEQVPNELIRHFMRGYFDGDGCISIDMARSSKWNTAPQPRCTIISTKEFLDEYLKRLPLSEEIIKNKKYSERKAGMIAKTVHFGGNNYCKAILDYLYKDSSIYLDRKYEKYISLFYR